MAIGYVSGDVVPQRSLAADMKTSTIRYDFDLNVVPHEPVAGSGLVRMFLVENLSISRQKLRHFGANAL